MDPVHIRCLFKDMYRNKMEIQNDIYIKYPQRGGPGFFVSKWEYIKSYNTKYI